MKAKLNRVELMGEERPNEKLRETGAVPFTDLQPSLTTTESQIDRCDLEGNRVPLQAEVFGSATPRTSMEEPIDPLGEIVANEIDKFPPEQEPVAGNLKMTGIVGEWNAVPRRVIASEEDFK